MRSSKDVVEPSNAEPLLFRHRGSFYEDCPGCKCMPREEDGPPIKNLALASFVMLCNALPIQILFPYLYFMVRDFHIASNADIGYYAGWVGSSFMIGRCLTGVLWGMVSDRYGRKAVMYSGIISILVFNTLFGFASTYWMALVTRFFLGSLNGMVGTLQAYASEICNKKHQSLGLALVSTMWGFGLIIGPALGGLLAQPALKFPDMFKQGSVFDRYPYLLPPLCVSGLALFVLFACHLLPETKHFHAKGEIETGVLEDAKQDSPRLLVATKSIFSNWALVASVFLFAIGCLHDIAYTEIFSLWAVRPKDKGGLAFSTSDIGRVLEIAGCGMLACQLCVFPWAARRFGPVLVTRTAAALTLPLLCIYPVIPKLEQAWMWVVLLLVSTTKYILMEATLTGLSVLINTSVAQEQRGTANGFSMSIFSLFKAIGPAAGGSVFAWSQNRFDAAFLPGNQLVFLFLGAWVLLLLIGTFEPFLPRSGFTWQVWK